MLEKLGYRKVACLSPKVFIGNPIKNVNEHIKMLDNLNDPYIALFPELSITGYTCEDLFFDNSLHEKTRLAVEKLINYSKNKNYFIVFGLPYTVQNRLYNCAMVLLKGKVISVVPKSFLPQYSEYYEKRWFTSGKDSLEKIEDFGQSFHFGTKQLINDDFGCIGIEICEDVWAINSPSQNLALGGAEIILNLSASNELVKKHEYRLNLVSMQSAKLNAIYCYAGAGSLESTRDLFFSGACIVAENGTILNEKRNFGFDSHYIECDVDIQKIRNERARNKTYASDTLVNYEKVKTKTGYKLKELKREYPKNPFMPKDDAVFEEIINIQSAALARRAISMNAKSFVLGLSGGSDSTLALIVCMEAVKKLNSTNQMIHTLSMPGFGTSERTKCQSARLASIAKTTFKEISIVAAVKSHLLDLNHKEVDVVYENAQARERTQILFDYANKESGLMVSGSDLSELCLGWSTFGGDSIGGYNVNSSIPKTLVKALIKYYIKVNNEMAEVLQDVLDTKVSPELLPLDSNGDIAQDTEVSLGSYDYHDFFIFHHLKNNFSKEKILFLANRTFSKDLTSELNLFYKRFYQNQFKRTMIPPGVKVGSVSVSIRGDLRLPDEINLDEE